MTTMVSGLSLSCSSLLLVERSGSVLILKDAVLDSASNSAELAEALEDLANELHHEMMGGLLA